MSICQDIPAILRMDLSTLIEGDKGFCCAAIQKNFLNLRKQPGCKLMRMTGPRGTCPAQVAIGVDFLVILCFHCITSIIIEGFCFVTSAVIANFGALTYY